MVKIWLVYHRHEIQENLIGIVGTKFLNNDEIELQEGPTLEIGCFFSAKQTNPKGCRSCFQQESDKREREIYVRT